MLSNCRYKRLPRKERDAIALQQPCRTCALADGDTSEKAKSTLKDAELLQQFKAVEQMNDDDRSVIKKVISAFITQSKLRQIAV